QIVRFATMAVSPFSLAADSWLRIHTTISICRVTYRSLCCHDSWCAVKLIGVSRATTKGCDYDFVIIGAGVSGHGADLHVVEKGQPNPPDSDHTSSQLRNLKSKKGPVSCRMSLQKSSVTAGPEHIEAFVRMFSNRQAFSAAALSSAPAALTQVSESACIHEAGPSPSAEMALFFRFKGDSRKDGIRRRVSRTNNININPVGDPGEN
nr:hypothetical protein [Tanacetum cinerariifolium]